VHDRHIRILEDLKATGDSSRVLNLQSVWSLAGHLPEYYEQPLFENKALNRSIILKHRLRSNEIDLFSSRPPVATKIILPLDSKDWKVGARFVFIGQRDYISVLENTFGVNLVRSERDMKVLRILDSTPSLDPFLVKEVLVKGGVKVSSCYFSISESDLGRMNTFLNAEISKLVAILYTKEEDVELYTDKLVSKIISGRADDGLEHLRLALGLSREDFKEGIFAWRGFLYYKWSQSNLSNQVSDLLDGLMDLMPRGSLKAETIRKIIENKIQLKRTILNSMGEIRLTLKNYDDSYNSLLTNNNPSLFRDFLLSSPELFINLGMQLGMLNYICNFWKFRFHPENKKMHFEADELFDLLLEFQQGLTGESGAISKTWERR
jgi:hypothetical protein